MVTLQEGTYGLFQKVLNENNEVVVRPTGTCAKGGSSSGGGFTEVEIPEDNTIQLTPNDTSVKVQASTAGGIVKLPCATELEVGATFNIYNSGSVEIQVQNCEDILIKVLPGNSIGNFVLSSKDPEKWVVGIGDGDGVEIIPPSSGVTKGTNIVLGPSMSNMSTPSNVNPVGVSALMSCSDFICCGNNINQHEPGFGNARCVVAKSLEDEVYYMAYSSYPICSDASITNDTLVVVSFKVLASGVIAVLGTLRINASVNDFSIVAMKGRKLVIFISAYGGSSSCTSKHLAYQYSVDYSKADAIDITATGSPAQKSSVHNYHVLHATVSPDGTHAFAVSAWQHYNTTTYYCELAYICLTEDDRLLLVYRDLNSDILISNAVRLYIKISTLINCGDGRSACSIFLFTRSASTNKNYIFNVFLETGKAIEIERIDNPFNVESILSPVYTSRMSSGDTYLVVGPYIYKIIYNFDSKSTSLTAISSTGVFNGSTEDYTTSALPYIYLVRETATHIYMYALMVLNVIQPNLRNIPVITILFDKSSMAVTLLDRVQIENTSDYQNFTGKPFIMLGDTIMVILYKSTSREVALLRVANISDTGIPDISSALEVLGSLKMTLAYGGTTNPGDNIVDQLYFQKQGDDFGLLFYSSNPNSVSTGLVGGYPLPLFGQVVKVS